MIRTYLAIGLILALALCGATATAQKGNLKIAGSTTVLPLTQVWAEAYMAKNPGVNVSVSGGGSGTGISMLLNGSCAIANSSRPASKREITTARARNAKLTETKLAKDGLAIVVHPSNNVKNLTMDQIAAIYRGKAATWKEVGGESAGAIVVVGRDSSSGTYGFFQQAVLGGGAYTKGMLSMPSNAAVAQAVSQSKDAVGYVGMAYAEQYEKQNKLRVVSVSRKTGEPGLKPTEQSVRDGSYPLFRFLYAYTLGNPSGLAGDFLKWCVGPEGQSLVPKSGYMPLK